MSTRKKPKNELLIGLIVTVVGGIIVATYQFLLPTEKEDKQQPVKKDLKQSLKPKNFAVKLDEFYTFDDYDRQQMEDGNPKTYAYNVAVKMGGFYLTSYFNRYNGTKRNIIGNPEGYFCDRYDMKSIVYSSGLPIFNPDVKQHKQVKTDFYDGTIKNGFAFYNPQLIKWATKYLIPNPQESNIQGILFQDAYNELYRRNFRLIAKSYLYFKDEKGYINAQKDYLSAMKKKNFYGPEYLLKKYYNEGESSVLFDKHTAIGFWIRRGIDGTNDEVWQCLLKILRLYDSKWYADNITVDNAIWEYNPKDYE